jgi:hypothetical protein
MAVRPIFVVGSPRSGTTMIGNYIGSAQSVLNAGEYRALDIAYGTLRSQLTGALAGLVPPDWGAHRDQYVSEVQRHAAEFIVRVAASEGRTAFCDSTPRNLLIATQLAEVFPTAVFVLTVRHYSGTIQSLVRLGMITVIHDYEQGRDRQAATAAAAGTLWSRHYAAASQLPPDRTITFGYDRFCAEPDPTLERFKASLASKDFPVDELDEAAFTVSHALAPGTNRATVGQESEGETRLNSIPSFDASAWTGSMEYHVRPAVEVVDADLRSWYPDDYRDPIGYRGAGVLIGEALAGIAPTAPADDE